MTTLYRLGIAPDDSDGEGEDHDEWFTSLRDAKDRRAELIAMDPYMRGHRYGSDFKIDRIEVADLPARALLLAVLNRRGWIKKCETVVEEYKALSHDEERLT